MNEISRLKGKFVAKKSTEIYIIKNRYRVTSSFFIEVNIQSRLKGILRVLATLLTSLLPVKRELQNRKKEKYLRLWWCFSNEFEHIWIHHITIYDFPVQLLCNVCHSVIICPYCFSIYFPSIKFYVAERNFFRSTTTRKRRFVLSTESETLFISKAKNINDSAFFFIWHKWHTQMNNAKKGKCYCANLSCFYLRPHPLRLVFGLAINFQSLFAWRSIFSA